MSWCEVILREIITRVKPHISLEDFLAKVPISGSDPVIGDFEEFGRLTIKYWK